MQGETKRQPPRIAASNWEEFSSKQTILSTFFNKGSATNSPNNLSSRGRSVTESASTQSVAPSSSPAEGDSAPDSTPTEFKSIKPNNKSRIIPNTTPKKRKPAEAVLSTSKKAKKQQPGQASLTSFFGKPKPTPASTSKSTSREIIDVDAPPDDSAPFDMASQMDADYQLALELSEASGDVSPSLSQPTSSQSKAAWSSLFTPVQPPKCTVHNEPTRKWTVNKPGPNKGRTFYLCSRCVACMIVGNSKLTT